MKLVYAVLDCLDSHPGMRLVPAEWPQWTDDVAIILSSDVNVGEAFDSAVSVFVRFEYTLRTFDEACAIFTIFCTPS